MTKRDPMYRAFADHAHFSSAKSVAPASTTPDDVKLYPISLDPPEHALYRSPFSSAFTLPAVRKRARAEIRVMLDEWPPRIPDFRLYTDAPPLVRTGVNGCFAKLPLVWDVRA